MQNEKDKTVTLTEVERKFIMIAMIPMPYLVSHQKKTLKPQSK